jgi:catechol 2,3-dioxygenase-like lactoylglutathione lyase family enzyme
VNQPPHVVRAIDHVGLTVPDIDAASDFLVAAFGAEVVYDMQPAAAAGDLAAAETTPSDQARLGVRPAARWRSSRLLRLGEGASIELFDYADPDQREPHTVADLGITHFGVYTDDIDATRERVVAAGGRALEGPLDLPREEAGDGNRWLYVIAPWGGTIEIVTYPSPMGYETTTELRRWKPAPRA